MKKLTLLMLLLIFPGLISCTAKNVVYQSPKNIKNAANEVFLFLPRTRVVIDIPVTKTTYDEKLNCNCLKDLGFEGHAKYDLGDIAVSYGTEPDSDTPYGIDVETAFYLKRTLNLQFDGNYVVSGAKADVQNMIPEYTAEAVKLAASAVPTVGRLALVKGAGCAPRQEGNQICADVARLIAEKKGFPDMVVHKMYAQEIKVEPDKVQTMIDQFNKTTEKVILSKIGGKVVTYTVRVEILPGTGDMPEMPLMRFSSSRGVYDVAADNPPTLQITVPADLQTSTPKVDGNKTENDLISLSITKDKNSCPGDSIQNLNVQDGKEHSFPYRIPCAGKITVTYHDGDQVKKIDQTKNIAQFGRLMFLPVGYGGSSTVQDVSYYSDTGALKSLNTTSTPMATSTIDTAGAGLVSSANAIQNANDPLVQLQRKRQLLEERLRMNMLLNGQPDW